MLHFGHSEPFPLGHWGSSLQLSSRLQNGQLSLLLKELSFNIFKCHPCTLLNFQKPKTFIDHITTCFYGTGLFKSVLFGPISVIHASLVEHFSVDFAIFDLQTLLAVGRPTGESEFKGGFSCGRQPVNSLQRVFIIAQTFYRRGRVFMRFPVHYKKP